LPAQQATGGGVTSHLSMSVSALQNTTRKLRKDGIIRDKLVGVVDKQYEYFKEEINKAKE